MARRPMQIGTYGQIKIVQLSEKPPLFEARARFRKEDGTFARPRRRGASRAAAERELKEAMVGLAEEVRRGELSRDTRMAKVADLWLAHCERLVALEELSHNTLHLYRSWTKNWVLPVVGSMTARELENSPMTCQKVITHAEDKRSKQTAGRVKVAFGLLCGWAVLHGAMTANPVKTTTRRRSKRKAVKALDLRQRLDLLEKMEVFAASRQVNKRGRRVGRQGRVWLDMPNRFRARLATGVRVGEIIALIGEDVDTKARTVKIDHHLVYIPGKGTVRMPGRKGDAPDLLLRYPEWSASMWAELKLASGGTGPLFPNKDGTWINPDDAVDQETLALKACGYGWVTGHVMRKTVAKVLKDAGLSVEQIADQLGNSPAVVRKYYLEIGVTNDEQAEALEGMFDEAEESG